MDRGLWVDDDAYECIDGHRTHEMEPFQRRDGLIVYVCARCGAESFDSLDGEINS